MIAGHQPVSAQCRLGCDENDLRYPTSVRQGAPAIGFSRKFLSRKRQWSTQCSQLRGCYSGASYILLLLPLVNAQVCPLWGCDRVGRSLLQWLGSLPLLGDKDGPVTFLALLGGSMPGDTVSSPWKTSWGHVTV